VDAWVAFVYCDFFAEWFPHNLSTAHATMQYNIAVAKTIRGQLDEAIALLKQVWQMSSKCKVPGHIIMLVLYIELKLGGWNRLSDRFV
jgi:CCR4-NOT transcription complex subunit 10